MPFDDASHADTSHDGTEPAGTRSRDAGARGHTDRAPSDGGTAKEAVRPASHQNAPLWRGIAGAAALAAAFTLVVDVPVVRTVTIVAVSTLCLAAAVATVRPGPLARVRADRCRTVAQGCTVAALLTLPVAVLVALVDAALA